MVALSQVAKLRKARSQRRNAAASSVTGAVRRVAAKNVADRAKVARQIAAGRGRRGAIAGTAADAAVAARADEQNFGRRRRAGFGNHPLIRHYG